jgi:hypothetical protein
MELVFILPLPPIRNESLHTAERLLQKLHSFTTVR